MIAQEQRLRIDTRSMHRAGIRCLWVITMLAACVPSGCKKASAPSPALSSPGQTNNASAFPGTQPQTVLVTTNKVMEPTPEQRIQSLTQTFSNAPSATRERIETAVAAFHDGKKREAVTQLKLVDADTELTEEQQTSIKEMILQMRK